MNYDHFFEQQLILEDDLVRLEPLEERHFELLLPAALHSELWAFTIQKINSPEDFRKYFDTAMLEKKQHRSYPFAYYNKKPTSMWAVPGMAI